MTRVLEITAPGGSGTSHLLIPNFYPPRHSYAIPNDVSLTLPPLTSNGTDGYHMKSVVDNHFILSGVPSPPDSDYSRNGPSGKESPEDKDITAKQPQARQTPPHSTSGSLASPVSYPLTPAPTVSDFMAFEMSLGSLPVRPSKRQQLQPQSYYTPPYGSPAMPAPSSLLGADVVQAPNCYPPRTVSTFNSLPQTITSGPTYLSQTSFMSQMPSKGSSYQALPGTFTWNPSPYAQSYLTSSAYLFTPTRLKPSTLLGPFSAEIWRRIFSKLDYESRLQLQCINSFFRSELHSLNESIKANPSPAQFDDMNSFVLQAENYRKHWSASLAIECSTHLGRPPKKCIATKRRFAVEEEADDESGSGKMSKAVATNGGIAGLGCYHCYTVQPPANFCLSPSRDDVNVTQVPENQAYRQLVLPRRYCLDCGIKKGFHKPNVYIERKWGDHVWVCDGCLAFHDHGVMNCGTCGRGCPLTPVGRSSRTTGVRRNDGDQGAGVMRSPPRKVSKAARTAARKSPGMATAARAGMVTLRFSNREMQAQIAE